MFLSRLGLTLTTAQALVAVLGTAAVTSAAHPSPLAFTALPTVGVAYAQGASFSATVSPTPTAQRRGSRVDLEWQTVTISNGAQVSYAVIRRVRNGPEELVCTGADTPEAIDNRVQCSDRGSRNDLRNSTYWVQAYLVGNDGSTTWSLPISSAAPT